MKQYNGVIKDEFSSNYSFSKEYPINPFKDNIKLEHHYVVPWELIEDDVNVVDVSKNSIDKISFWNLA